MPDRKPGSASALELPRFTTVASLLRELEAPQQGLYVARSDQGPILVVEASSALQLPTQDRAFPVALTRLEELVVGTFGLAVTPQAPEDPAAKERLNDYLKALPGTTAFRTYPYTPDRDQPQGGFRQYQIDCGQFVFDLTLRLASIPEREVFDKLVALNQGEARLTRTIGLIGYVNVRMFATAEMADSYANSAIAFTPSSLIFNPNAARTNPAVRP